MAESPELYHETRYANGEIVDVRFGLEPGVNDARSPKELALRVRGEYISRFNTERAGTIERTRDNPLPIPPIKNMEGTQVSITTRDARYNSVDATLRQGLSDASLAEFVSNLTLQ